MSQDAPVSYSAFPHLGETYDLDRNEASLQTQWQTTSPSLPQDILVLAFAHILRAYTGIPHPVFSLNGTCVQVDLAAGRWNQVEVELTDSSHTRPTSAALSLHPANCDAGPFALHFHYEGHSGAGRLSSSESVPASFLPQIELQLLRKISSLFPNSTFQNLYGPLKQWPLLSVVNPERKVLKGAAFLHHMIRYSEKSSSIAIDFLGPNRDRREITYQNLDNLTNRLASRLKQAYYKLQVATESDIIIPVLVPQCPELYISWIAILKAGAAFCPLPLDVPPERLAFILEDVQAKIVITTSDLRKTFEGVKARVEIVIPTELDGVEEVEDDNTPILSEICGGEDSVRLAYVMYTSGSTGLPKGVRISHWAVSQALLAHQEHVPYFARFLQFASPTFDVSVFETFFPFSRGAILVCCDREMMLRDLPGVIATLNVDAAELTPTVAGTLIRERKAVPTLKALLTIGEMLTRSVIEEFGGSGDQEGILLAMYGPTEASIHCTVANSMRFDTKTGIIGRPLSTVTAFIVNEPLTPDEGSFQILPTGQIGELVIGGQLASGYLNRPEQTRSVFIELPEYGPVYRTGDRARLLPNGELECLGRISAGQVKIRGQRVELGEVEQIACKAPGVDSAFASIINEVLVLFCLAQCASPSTEEVQTICKSWLPRFMRPGDIVMLNDDIPRLPSGKVDKKKLENDYRLRIRNEQMDVEDPHNEIEDHLVQCVENELGFRATRSESLWAHGLDSLRAIKIASRLRDLDIWTTASEVLAADTVAGLAEQIQKHAEPTLSRTTLQVDEFKSWKTTKKTVLKQLHAITDSSNIEDVIPCSPLQIAMLAETVSKKELNFNTIEVRFSPKVSVADFRNAFRKVACSNAILRSGFVGVDEIEPTFAQITWKHFDKESPQLCKSTDTSTQFHEDWQMSLLQPLTFQIHTSDDDVRCVFRIHHALYDGWSWELIMKDLETLLCHRSTPLRPPFQRVTEYQHHIAHTRVAADARDYWEEHLRGVKPTLLSNFHTSTPKPFGRQVFGRNLDFALSSLSRLSQSLRISRPSVISAACAYLLSSYTGSSSVIFGTVSSGRTAPIRGIEDIIGPCISTLPLRIDVSRLRTVKDLLHLSNSLHNKILELSPVSLRELKKCAGVAGDASLFDTLLVWQESLEDLRGPQGLLSVVETVDSLDYSMVLEVEPNADRIHIKVTFETSKIPTSQIELFVAQLDQVLNLFANTPESLLEDTCCSLSTSVLSIANPYPVQFDKSFTLTSTIERIATAQPDQIAIDFADDFEPEAGTLSTTRITYYELNKRATAICQGLKTNGVLANDLVCVFIEKSVDLYCSILAVIKCGAGYLAIDPKSPRDRVQAILAEADARLVMSHSTLKEETDRLTLGKIFLVDRIKSEDARAVENGSAVTSDGSDLAYAVFTSGSTGIPKGLLITKTNLLSNIDVLSKQYPHEPGSRLLQACSPAFDVSVFEIFFTWHNGMCLCAAKNDVLFRDMEQIIRLMNITHLSLTPSVAALIDPTKVPSVQMLVTAGEPMNSKVFGDWAGNGLYQAYGPSETTNVCTLRPRVALSDSPSNIGFPFANTSLFVSSSRNFRPLPQGSVGEIWIGGDQIGRGYLNPDLTAVSFHEHPIYGRIYRSGDIGRLLPDGSLFILGRDDDQVKLRGQRIELGDINHALVQSPAVSDAVTLMIKGSQRYDPKLVSFWTSNNKYMSSNVVNEQVLEEVEARLPAYMVPDVLIPIEVMPLTPQGKIDKRFLVSHFQGLDESVIQKFYKGSMSSDDNESFTDVERTIAVALSEVSGARLSTIHRNTSFFALGIDSISSIKLAATLRAAGVGQTDVSQILRCSSIRRLVDSLPTTPPPAMGSRKGLSVSYGLFDESWEHNLRASCAKLGYVVDRILPCTPLQESMLSSSDSQEKTTYQNRLTFQINGDLARLKATCIQMVSRHQILRTGFALTDSSRFAFAQVVFKTFDLPWLSDREIEAGESDSSPHIQKDQMKPPYIFKVFESANGTTTLSLYIHHALYDGEAFILLLKDIEASYNRRELLSVTPFDHYLNYMVEQDTTAANDFWQNQLKNYRPRSLAIAQDSTFTAEQGLLNSLHLTSALSIRLLESECRSLSCTLLSLLQATWTRLLAYHLESSDVCFGNVYSGRNLPIEGVENIVGPCFNTLPVRMRLDTGQTNAAVIGKLQATNLATFPFQSSSLRQIQKVHNKFGQRLFDTLILLQSPAPKLDDTVWTLIEDSGDMGFPFILEMIPDQEHDRLNFVAHYDPSIISRSKAECILDDYDTLLQHTVQYSSAQASDFSQLKSKPILSKSKSSNRVASQRGSKYDHRNLPGETSWSLLEIEVRQILSRFSGVEAEKIVRTTTIFQLGLDSINSVQIASELRRKGFIVTGGDILEYPTILEIAAFCEKQKHEDAEKEEIFDFEGFDRQYRQSICDQFQISNSSIAVIRPCTSTQSGILAQFIASRGTLYLNHVDLRLMEDMDPDRLKRAWQDVTNKYEVLRTGFIQIENGKYLFAMITYSQGVHIPRWTDGSNSEEAHTRSQPLGEQLLESLYQPPWHITFSKDQGGALLRISILHSLYDARSLDLILHDVVAAYRGSDLSSTVQTTQSLPTLLSKYLSEDEKSKSFWTKFKDSLQPTKFPDLTTRRCADSSTLVLSRKCSRSYSDLLEGCKNAEVTLQAASQCAWGRVLSAYTEQVQVTFGVVLSGRTALESFDNFAFPAINTVPAPIEVQGTNETLLKRTLKRNASLIKSQFTPLPKIKRWLDIEEDLFDTVLVLQERGHFDLAAPLWRVESEVARTEYAVSIEIAPLLEGEILLRLTTTKDILPAEQAKLLLQQFDSILTDTIFSPHTNSHDYSSLDPKLLSSLPAQKPYIETSTETLHQFVEDSTRQYPNRTALEFVSEIETESLAKTTWTYKKLDEEGNKIAHLLLRYGALPGDLLGICFDKCPEAYFAILGILKAGCAYVAIDPGAPQARKDFILRDSACKILLCTQDKLRDLELLTDIYVIALDELRILHSLPSEMAQLPRKITREDTCYCLYTSGTTGTPKGCLITHGNAVQFTLGIQEMFDGHWDKDSRWLQFASFHFDVSVLEQYWSWSVGICVISAPRDLLFEDIAGAIRALEITHIDLTPSLARLLSPEDVPSLCRGVFITGGEQLRQDVLDKWGDIGVLYNGYGPSEVTIGCTMYPRVPRLAKPSNIGPQYVNVGSFVLDPGSKRPVLRGGIGELCVSGKLVGRGYLNRPELTREKFEQIPELNARVYHTGDMVRMLHDGSFDFLGRADDQVKLRGQRLEISEINHVIRESTNIVKDVMTMVLKHEKQPTEQIVSFISTKERNTFALKPEVIWQADVKLILPRVRRYCIDHLPRYMVPTHILPISAIPLSANNKVEFRQLSNLFSATSIAELQALLVDNSKHKLLDSANVQGIAKVLAETLGIAQTTINSSSRFFELGLDSISAIAFSRSMKNAGFGGAHPALIMRNPTVADLVGALHSSPNDDMDTLAFRQEAERFIAEFARKHQSSITASIGIRLEEIERIAPCTPLQEGMIFNTVDNLRLGYFSTFNYRTAHPLENQQLGKAWQRLQRKHQILRTMFVLTSDGYAQVVMKKCSTSPYRHLRISHNENFEEHLSQVSHLWRERVRNFDQLPWEVTLLEKPSHNIMSLNIFHGLYDGFSLPLLLEDLAQEYLGNANHSKKAQYHDILPSGPLRRMNLEEVKNFWVESLPERLVTLLSLPAVDTNTNTGAAVANVHKTKIPYVREITQLRLKLNVTEPAFFHAAWLLTLHREFRVLPTLGLVVSGRALNVAGAEEVIGPMFNTLPCHILFDGITSMADLICKCHSFNVESLPYQHTALRDIAKWIGKDPRQALFDSLFVFQKTKYNTKASEQLWSPLDVVLEPDYPLAIEIEQDSTETFNITIVGQAQHLRMEVVQDLSNELKRVITEITQDSDQPLPSNPAFSKKPALPTPNEVHTNERSAGPFHWTDDAQAIRRHISSLANVKPEEVNADTSIFELGLDSIDAIKLSARMKSAGMSLPVSRIMRMPSIRSMIQDMAANSNSKDNSLEYSHLLAAQEKLRNILRHQSVDMDAFENVLPVTPLQEGMLARFEQYYSFDVLELSPEMEETRVKAAFAAVVKAHPILRTKFVEVQDAESEFTFAQLVPRSAPLSFKTISLKDDSELSRFLEGKHHQVSENGLEQATVDVTLVDITSRKLLVLGMAHAAYDGWSLDLLHQDIALSYHGSTCERPTYEAALEDIVGLPINDASKFWAEILSGFCLKPFPLRQLEKSSDTNIHRKEARSTFSAKQVRDFCKLQGVTLQSLGLTCWILVLAGYLKTFDVCSGLVLSGRTMDDADQMMFPTMNTVAFRTKLKGSRRAMIKQVHDLGAEISEYQHFPLRRAKAVSETAGQLFDSLFIYQKRPAHVQQYAQLYHSVGGFSNVEYPVNVEMEVCGENLIWRSACRDVALDDAGTEGLLQRLNGVMGAILGQPQREVLEHLPSGISICGLPAIRVATGAGINRFERGHSPEDHSISEEDFSPSEEVVRDVLSVVAHIPRDQITKASNLFHLGLDSISAIKVSSMLRERSISLPVSEMLETLTLEKMALAAMPRTGKPVVQSQSSARLIDYMDVHEVLRSAGLETQEVEKVLPMTAGQKYFLGMWKGSGGKLFYNEFQYKVSETIRVDVLERAWKCVVERIPMLRTTFIDSPSTAVQVVLKSVPHAICWEAEQVSKTASCNEWQRSNEGGHARSPVRLLAEKTPSGVIITLQIHHALYDGVSLPRIVRVLARLCQNPDIYPSINVEYEQFIAHTEKASRQEDLKAFWMSYLGKRSVLVEDGAPRFEEERTRWYHGSLIDDLAEVEDRNKVEGISLHALFLAAYGQIHAGLVSRVSGEEETVRDVIIGLYLANRSWEVEGLPDLLAPTVNIVPLRIQVDSDLSLVEMAQKVQGELVEIGRMDHSGVSLEEIYEWTGVQLDCVVNLLRLPEEEERWEADSREKVLEPIERGKGGGVVDGQMGGVGPSPFTGAMSEGKMECYRPSIDIEAGIRQGRLDVGVFAPKSMLDARAAEEALAELRRLLLNGRVGDRRG